GPREPRHVPAGPGEARDKAALHRVPHAPHNDRNRLGGVLGGLHAFRPLTDNDVHRETDQLGSERGEVLELPLGKAVLDGEVVPAHPAALTPCVAEGFQRARQVGVSAGAVRKPIRGRCPDGWAEEGYGAAQRLRARTTSSPTGLQRRGRASRWPPAYL